MIVCGIKLTHDGGVAIIEDGELAFSVEMEKLDNGDRHRRIEDMSEIFEVLRRFGYRPGDVDIFSIDGWRKTDKTKSWNGQEVRVQLAPYLRGFLSDDPMQEYRFRILDFEYVSFPHYSGHVLGGYCTSPFARRGEDSFVLSGDGAMFPYLFRVEAATGRVRNLGVLSHFLGDAYHAIAQRCAPFDAPIEWPATLALPGKIMAYIARGRVRNDLRERMHGVYSEVSQKLLGEPSEADAAGWRFTEPLGRRFLERYNEALQWNGASDADVLATWHAFLGGLLVDSLAAKLRGHGARPKNLVLVGGSALNIKWNRQLRERGVVDEIWIPPFPNDSGAAIGAACCAWVKHVGLGPIGWDVYSGPEFRNDGATPGWRARPCSIPELAAVLHESDEPVAFLHGRAELGPRALGNRSLLASPVSRTMKDRLNRIKRREGYRPVAPVCLEHRAPEVFDPGTPDPFMLFDHDVRPEWLSRIPAVCHEDGSARLQTVNRRQNPRLFELLTEYERRSRVPVLCNTSANRPGKGFFPDLSSATSWGGVSRVWCEDVLYVKQSGESNP